MSKELIYVCGDGMLNFGDHTLKEKKKMDNFEYDGDIYKVKTFKTITKLEKNGMFTYESVPGTTVTNFKNAATGVTFTVEGSEDTQIIVGLEDGKEYEIFENDEKLAIMKSNMGGKLVLSFELGAAPVKVHIEEYK